MLFRQFSNITIYIRDVEKLPDQHFSVLLFSNPGGKILKRWKLQDKSVPYFQQESGSFLLDWRTTIHWNVGLANFQHPWYTWFCWKIAGTTFPCIVVLQSRRKGPDSCWNLMMPGSQSATYIIGTFSHISGWATSYPQKSFLLIINL